jgi:hypothetical protein
MTGVIIIDDSTLLPSEEDIKRLRHSMDPSTQDPNALLPVVLKARNVNYSIAENKMQGSKDCKVVTIKVSKGRDSLGIASKLFETSWSGRFIRPKQPDTAYMDTSAKIFLVCYANSKIGERPTISNTLRVPLDVIQKFFVMS